MRRTNVVRVLPDKQQRQTLEIIGDRCAALWNTVQYRCRQAFSEGEPVPSYETLCSEFKKPPAYRALPTHIGQEVLKRGRKAWDSFFAPLRLYRKSKMQRPPRLPRYWKDRRTGRRIFRIIPVKAPTSCALDSRTLPRDLREEHGGRLVLHTKGVLRFHGTPKTLKLKDDPVKRRWYAHQVVEVPEPVRRTRPEKRAALD